MPLKSVDDNGNILELFELDQTFSSYRNPWGDPYSDLSKYFSAQSEAQINEGVDLSTVSAAVDLVSFRNLDDWCYTEQFDKRTLAQVSHVLVCSVTLDDLIENSSASKITLLNIG